MPIRIAEAQEVEQEVNPFVQRRYAARGYPGIHHVTPDAETTTFVVTEDERLVATLTLHLDSPKGLLADELFQEQTNHYRQQGQRLCELTKLAADGCYDPRLALKALFGAAFGEADGKCDVAVIEVNPRHRFFYEAILGFRSCGAVRMNPRVNAPACLLAAELQDLGKRIQKKAA